MALPRPLAVSKEGEGREMGMKDRWIRTTGSKEKKRSRGKGEVDLE